MFGNGRRLRRDGVLVGVDIGAGWWRREGLRVGGGEGARVDGRHDRKVVLVLVEVSRRGGEGVIERVQERRVEGPKGELVDYVGKIECCFIFYIFLELALENGGIRGHILKGGKKGGRTSGLKEDEE